MTTPIVSVDAADADLSEAASIMLERRVHRVFTQMEAIRARARTPSRRLRPAEEILSYETINLDADTPLYRAAGHAIATKVRRIPAVDGEEPRGHRHRLRPRARPRRALRVATAHFAAGAALEATSSGHR